MSKIDYQALREAAEKATWGDWDSYKPHRGARGYEVRLSSQAIAQHVLKNNAEFIAAFNPKIALALLDERERNQQYIKSRDQENEDIALTVGKLLIENGRLVADTLRHLADNEIDSDYFAITSTNENGTEIDHEMAITDYALQAAGTVDELVAALESAEKRIAELESNEVREVGNQFLVVRHPGKTPVIKHCTGDLEEFLRKLIEQDPLVTIDIITHRYYGIGGQWVQDAVEYLHMMSDADIRIKGE
ncbi:ead/Ea22-like family protein [Escherichia coli]|uniref:ead/Ea22-like family protein n=1 Tax=Escherichia coli TaxID=562 RepID=UPI000BE6C555|nr:ead/Ea22-like family protein [Escherichia coli]EFB6653867.1 ead/Ea22-like family protein [Escherichia coli]EFN5752019.1 ead/Ea22-like family protein [Escherichia coli]EGX7008131.1 ead/Ea22-like family protein [Escherichia coli]EHH5165169.1 ead/Ea22-like family protein [Escherichia coli]EHV4736798.1 ead/Ea22-like family protein [Escherichia coli]